MKRKDLRLENNYKCILEYVGIISILIGLITFIPLLCIPFYPEEAKYAVYFFAPGILTLLFGLTCKYIFAKKNQSNLSINQDVIIVIIAWIIAVSVSAMPFYLSGQLGLNQSFFESISGYSTCGLSMYMNLDNVPKIFLFHRSFTQFLGGIGIVVVITSFLPISFGTKLYFIEGHSDRVLPSVKRTGKIILKVYSAYVLLGTIFYALGNMNIFEGLNHSLAAISTGGFGTETLNIAAFNSPYIETVTIILMLLGSTYFYIHYLLITGKGKIIPKVGEIRFLGFLLLFFIPILTLFLPITVANPLRQSIFNFVSAITTTGFSTTTFSSWSSPAVLIIIIAMIIGGGSGSTAGGIKYSRVYILFKSLYWNIRDSFKSHHTLTEKFVVYPNGKKGIIAPSALISLFNFVFLYALTTVIGTFLLTTYGYSIRDSLFEFSSALSATGLTIGVTSPDMGAGPIWILNAAMFLGRLEILIVIVAVVKTVIDGKNLIEYEINRFKEKRVK